jgi:hypothetical protein
MAVDDNGSQDYAAGYDGEGQERAARDGKKSRVAMMAVVKTVAAEDNSSGQQQGWWRTMVANNGSRQ